MVTTVIVNSNSTITGRDTNVRVIYDKKSLFITVIIIHGKESISVLPSSGFFPLDLLSLTRLLLRVLG